MNRHQSYPYLGYAMVERGQRLDARILKKELGLNAVRCSHYPQSQYFIDECDRLGLLVFIETVGWQHIGDNDWQDIAVNNVEAMVTQYRNHPSIMMWGVRVNESEDNSQLYTKTNHVAHLLDPTRVTGGVRCIKNSELLEDVYTYNEFVHNGSNIGAEKKSNITKDKKPYMISEYNGHMYPTKSFDPERIRCEHALRHAKVLNSINQHDDIVGGFGWCMFDYNTHKDFGSGDRICYHGIMDMFRNPKMAADVYASQADDFFLSISSNMDIGEYPGACREDIYAFTNADSVRLSKNDKFINEFYPKNSKFKYLNHPPILIDDLIGNLIEVGEGLDFKTSEKIKLLLIDGVKYGIDNLPLKTKLNVAYLVVVKKLKPAYVSSLFNKYVNNWGSTVTEFKFEGIKDNRIIKTVVKKACNYKHLEVNIDSTELIDEDSYDIATFRFRMVDENNNLLSFNNDVIQIDVKGPVEVIGPKLISLKGGMAGSYIKSTSKGESVVIIKVNQEVLKYNINVI
jgi:beta-galactosidase